MAATFFLLLPPLSALAPSSPFARSSRSSATPYTPLRAGDSTADESDAEPEEEEEDADLPDEALLERADEQLPHLTTREKLELARPLVRRYMLPLFFVYLAEYTINSGVAPTLLYEVPTRERAPVLALVIHSLRDYYPLWALLYQTFVFVSRSSLSILRLPPLPLSLLPLPTLLQLLILALTFLEARTGFLVALAGEHGATWAVALLVCAEGLCGGAAYVNAFHRLATVLDEEEDDGGAGPMGKDRARADQEREFCIAAVGCADSTGILLAALLSTILEPYLCAAQVARGRTYCREL
ncbi:battenin CLN3 protein [Rhodotorula kratochvilovae]